MNGEVALFQLTIVIMRRYYNAGWVLKLPLLQ